MGLDGGSERRDFQGKGVEKGSDTLSVCCDRSWRFGEVGVVLKVQGELRMISNVTMYVVTGRASPPKNALGQLRKQ